MKMNKLVPNYDPVLRQVAQGLQNPILDSYLELNNVVHIMHEIVSDKNVLGIAAPQIGVSVRLIIVKVLGKIVLMINPEVDTINSSLFISLEGCLSVPNKTCFVPRYKDIIVTYYNSLGAIQSLRLNNQDAAVVQHEVDHLNGILMTDRALSVENILKPLTK